MSDDASAENQPFDLDRLRELVEMMEKHGLTEVSLQRGDQKWRLRRGPHEVVQMVPGGQYQMPQGYAPSALSAQASAGGGEAAPAAPDNSILIKSPTVGTFYASPSPDDPAFVTAGSQVRPDTIVCIVEAMKVFNQIPAEVSGTIVEVLINSGDSVEFGQPLFRVRPA